MGFLFPTVTTRHCDENYTIVLLKTQVAIWRQKTGAPETRYLLSMLYYLCSKKRAWGAFFISCRLGQQ